MHALAKWKKRAAAHVLTQAKALREQERFEASKGVIDRYVGRAGVARWLTPPKDRLPELEAFRNALCRDIEQQRKCINASDAIDLEPIGAIANKHFVKTADGYGHNAVRLAYYLRYKTDNPATRLPLTAPDIEKIRSVSEAAPLVLEAAKVHENNASRLMARHDYVAALPELADAALLNPRSINCRVMRIDCLAALGAFAAALEATALPAGMSACAWRLRVREAALKTALTGKRQATLMPPLREDPVEIFWAAMTLLHCHDYKGALDLSTCAAGACFSAPDLKAKCAQIASMARTRQQSDADPRAALQKRNFPQSA